MISIYQVAATIDTAIYKVFEIFANLLSDNLFNININSNFSHFSNLNVLNQMTSIICENEAHKI